MTYPEPAPSPAFVAILVLLVVVHELYATWRSERTTTGRRPRPDFAIRCPRCQGPVSVEPAALTEPLPVRACPICSG